MKKSIFLAIIIMATACSPAVTSVPTTTQIPSATTRPQTSTSSPTLTLTSTITATATLAPTATATSTSSPAPTESLAEMLKTHIVFYLILPETGHTDACGKFTLEPIITKRFRTGDKVQDVQIALNTMFGLGVKYYGAYYNALWNTDLTINSYEYFEKQDYMIMDFGGFLPVKELSRCDKHGIHEQIWKTFFYYKFKEKTFTINGKFLIDQLGR